MSDKIVWSGKTSSYHHKWNDTPNPPEENTEAGLRKVWYLDAQWSTCPIEVELQVKDLWRLMELGNDHYMIKTSIQDLLEYEANDVDVEQWNDEKSKWGKVKLKTNAIVQWIREQAPEMNEDELIIIHWWW